MFGEVISMRHAVIVTAAGSSSRFNNSLDSHSDSLGVKKEFIKVQDETILSKAIKPFLLVDDLVAVVVTYKEEFFDETIDCLRQINIPERIKSFLVKGGATRQESVFNALQFLDEEVKDLDLVSIHDGARPFITKALIENCLEVAAEVGGAVPALPMSDTLVKVENGKIIGSLDRAKFFNVQTPQTFRFPEIYKAHLAARNKANDGLIYTDDTQIFTDYGLEVAIVKGDPNNKKITYPRDLEKL